MIKQFLAASLLLLAMTACGNQKPPDNALHPTAAVEEGTTGMYTSDTRITEVVGDPVFGDYGRLIFPAGNGYYSGDTLGNLSLTWYTHIDPEMTVEVANYFREHAQKGDVIFYDIYTDEERAADPEKADTGLSEVTGEEPPTYCCVGTSDGIASYRVMEERVRRIQANGTDTEIEVFQGLPHGFGLGEGTVAEGWIDRAIDFWERQMQ